MLSVFVSVALVVSLCPAVAMAEINDGTAGDVSTENGATSEIEVTAELDGFIVVEVEPAVLGEDYVLVLDPADQYDLPEIVLVTIDAEEFEVYTDGEEHRDIPEGKTEADLPVMPAFDPEKLELTIPAELLTEQTVEVLIEAEAVEVTVDDADDPVVDPSDADANQVAEGEQPTAAEDAAVAEVQAMIDALPTSITNEAEYEAALEAYNAIDEYWVALTEDQQAQINTDNFFACREALDAYEGVVEEADVWVTNEADESATGEANGADGEYVVGDRVAANNTDASLPDNIPAGTQWVLLGESVLTCEETENHTHSLDSCYTHLCLHGLSHSSSCIPNGEKCSTYSWGSCSSGHAAHYSTGPILSKTYYGGTCNHVCSVSNGCYVKTCRIEEGHDHSSENNCYTYTWTLNWKYYEVGVSTVAVDAEGDEIADFGYVATISEGTGYIQHGIPFTVTADAVEFYTPIASYNGIERLMELNSEGTAYTATFIAAANGTVKVTYTAAEKHNVTLVVEGESYGDAKLTPVGSLPEGTRVALVAAPNTDTDSAKYSMSISVQGATLDSDNTFVVGESDVVVTVIFSKRELVGNTSASIGFNPALSAADQLDALKQEIFSQLAIGATPAIVDSDEDGYLWDELTYEAKVWRTYSVGGNALGGPAITDVYAAIGVDPDDEDVTLGYYTTHPFGYRGVSTTESVMVSYNGLYIEADVTLTDNRPAPSIELDYSKLATSYNTAADFVAAVKRAVVVKDGDGEVITDKCGEVTVDVAQDGDTNKYEVSASVELGGTTWKPGEASNTLSATFVVSTYTVKWVDGDGNAVEIDESVEYGATPKYNGEDPTKTATDQYTYSFSGSWDKEIVPVVEDTVYTAQFTSTVKTYTVTWKNYDGTVLETDEDVEYGTVPTYEGDKPVREADKAYTYSFSGWDPGVSEVTRDATYTATFSTTDVYEVAFVANYEGAVAIDSAYVECGETVSAREISRDGYRLDGWYTDPTFAANTAYDFNTPVEADITLYAKWVEQIDLTFDVDGAAAIDSQTIDINTSPAPVDDPSKDGYTFMGWFTDSDFKNAYSFETPLATDTILYAKFISNDCVIAVSGAASYTVDSGSAINGNTQTTVIGGKRTVQVALTPADGTYITGVTVNGEAAQVAYADGVATVSVNCGVGTTYNVVAASADFFTLTGSATVEYYLGMDAATLKANILEAVVVLPSDVSGDGITVKFQNVIASWPFSEMIELTDDTISEFDEFSRSEETITLSYTGNGSQYPATSTTEIKLVLKESRDDFSVTTPVSVPYNVDENADMFEALKSLVASSSEKVSYYIDGGLIGSDTPITHEYLAATAANNPAGTITVTVEMPAKDDTYAPGTKEVVVSFSGVYFDVPVYGGTVNGDATTVRAYYAGHGDAASFTLDSQEGYNMYVAVNDDAVLVKNADGSYSLSEVDAATVLTITAKKLHTVTYTDGVEGEEIFADQVYTVEEGVSAPVYDGNADVRDFYRFANWTETVDNDGNVVYTAVWTLKNDGNGNGTPDEIETYTVKYMVGEAEYETFENVAWGDPTPKPEVSPSKDGFSFANWEPLVAAKAAAPSEGNVITYTAVWNAKGDITVSFNTDGGSEIEPQTFTADGLATEPDDIPVKQGYRFDGWYADSSCTIPYDFKEKVTESITLYAKWVEQVTVTFDSKGGSEVVSQTIDINGTVTEPSSAPTKDNHTFAGWYSDEACQNEFGFKAAVTESTTVYAKWICNDSTVAITGENITYTISGGTEDSLPEGSEVTVVLTPKDGYYITEATFGVGDNVGAVESIVDGVATITFTTGRTQNYEITATTAAKRDTAIKVKDDLGVEYYGNEITDAYVLEKLFDSVISGDYVVTNNPGDSNLSIVSTDYSIMGATLYSYTISKWSDALGAWIPNGTSIGGSDYSILDVADTYKIEVVYSGNYMYNASEKTAIVFDVVDPRGQGSLVLHQDVEYKITDLSNAVLDETAIIEALVDKDSSIGEEYGDLDVIYVAKYNEESQLYVPVLVSSDGKYYLSEYGKYQVRVTMADSDEYLGTDVLGSTGYLTIVDARIKTLVNLNDNVEITYAEELTEEDVFNAVFATVTEDESGEAVEAAYGENISIEIPDGIKAGTQTVTVKYAGDNTHAAASAEVEVTIAKADTQVDVASQVLTYAADGYLTGGFVSSNPEVNLITMAAGLKMGDDASADLGTAVYLNIPNLIDLSTLDNYPTIKPLVESAMGSLSDGSELSVAELKTALETLKSAIDGANGLIGSFTDFSLDTTTIDFIVDVLGQIEQLDGVGDITVYVTTDAEGIHLVDSGVYLVAAVSADANYNTAYDLGYAVIVPDATKVELGFNVEDENHVVTLKNILNGNYDLGSHVVQGDLTDEQYAEASAQLEDLFVGVDIEGNPVIVQGAENIASLGAYTQISYIVDLGNTMYYAEPIVRAFVVVTDLVDVAFVDAEGNDLATDENGLAVVSETFAPGVSHEMTAVATDRSGGALDSANITYTYVGVEGDAEGFYAKGKAGEIAGPTEAGLYEVIATYIDYDESGNPLNVGMGFATLIVLPAEASVDVVSKYHTYDGSSVDVAAMVESSPEDAKTAIVMAGIDVSGDFSENGLAAVKGVVNVDFPSRVDAVLQQFVPSAYEGGVTIESFNGKLAEVQEALEAAGLDTEAISEIAAILEGMPNATKLTFKEQSEVNPTAIGSYLVIGLVMDPNYQADLDLGVLVIAPELTAAELQWNYEDANGIITSAVIDKVDMGASAYVNDELNDKYTEQVAWVFVGIDEQGNIVVTDDAAELGNGFYTQIAFVGEVSADMAVAEPIMRSVLVAPQIYNVTFVDEKANPNNDRQFTYDGQAHGMDVLVTNASDDTIGTTLEGPIENLTVTYVGIEGDVEGYCSTEAPAAAGLYNAIAVYAERDANGELLCVGAAVGILKIWEAEASVDVVSKYHTHNGEAVEVSSMITVDPEDAKLVVITSGLEVSGDFSENGLSAVVKTTNVDFPSRVDAVLKQIIPTAYEKGIAFSTFAQKVEDITAALEAAGIDASVMDEVLAALSEVPDNVVLTLKDEFAVSDIGVYMVAAVVMDPDYREDMDLGMLVIGANVDTGKLAWNYEDANGIITTPVVNAIDFGATAYIEGQQSDQWTSEIQYLVIGLSDDDVIYFGSDMSGVDEGVYTQVAYIYDEVSASMTVALPIMRTVVVVPQTVDVDFVDAQGENNERLFTYDGTPKAMDVKVTDLAGNEVTGDRLENLTVTYVGFDSELNFYKGTEAPSAVGSYKVYANYLERDAAGNVAYIGGAVGLMVIDRADAGYALSNVAVAHDGTEKWVDVVNGGGYKYEVSAVVDESGNVNVIAPEGWTVEPRSIENVDELLAALAEDAEAKASVAQDEAYQAALDKFAAALRNADIESIKINGAKPSEVGVYRIHTVAFGSTTNKPAYDAATLTITHDPAEAVIENEVEADCLNDGSYDTVVYCTECGEELSRETAIVEALGHTEVVDPAVPATCTATGLTEGSHCDVCGDVLAAQEVVPAKGHDTELVGAKEATATESGYSGDLVCMTCYEVVEKGEEIPALGNDPVDTPAVIVSGFDAGLLDVTVSWSGGSAKLADGNVSVPAGTEVTLTVTVAEGKELASFAITCGEDVVIASEFGNGVFTFEAEAGKTYTVSATAKAAKTDISNADIGGLEAWYEHTGNAIEPAITVTLDGETLVKDVDYTVAYANNVDPGTATVTVTGIGNYTSTVSATFEIVDSEALFKIYGTNVGLYNDLGMNFFVLKSDMEKVEATGGYYAEIIKTFADGRANDVYQIAFADWGEQSADLWRFGFRDIAAKEMSDTVTVRVYDENGVPVSQLYTDSLRDYAMRGLEATANYAASYKELRTTLVDMLNYGAAAQLEFNYNTGDLANKLLTEAQKAEGTASIECVNSLSKGEDGLYYGTTVAAESNLVLTLYFTGIDAATHAVVTYAGQSYTVDAKDFHQRSTVLTGIVVNWMVVADCSELVTVEVYNGETLIASATDSIESYAARAIDKINSGAGDNLYYGAAVYENMMKFANAARAYFATLQ